MPCHASRVSGTDNIDHVLSMKYVESAWQLITAVYTLFQLTGVGTARAAEMCTVFFRNTAQSVCYLYPMNGLIFYVHGYDKE